MSSRYNRRMPDVIAPSRLDLRRRRRDILPRARMAAAEAVAEHLLTLADAPREGYVAGYWAMDGELPLHAWQVRLPPACIYCLPVLDDTDGTLKFAPWKPGDTLASNRYGIPEPDLAPTSLLDANEMAMIAMPLTGFDAGCRRIGMGGGWYDRSLAFRATRAAPPLLVGIAFDVQEIPLVSAQPWDIACDAIVTESRTLLRTPT